MCCIHATTSMQACSLSLLLCVRAFSTHLSLTTAHILSQQAQLSWHWGLQLSPLVAVDSAAVVEPGAEPAEIELLLTPAVAES